MEATIQMIHILHHQKDEIINWINQVKSDNHENSIENEEKYNFIISVNEPGAADISSRSRLLIPGEEGDYREFIVDYAYERTEAMEKEVYTKGSFVDIRKLRHIEPQTLNGQTVQTAGSFVLSGLPWELGICDYSGIRKWVIEKHLDAYEALKAIAVLFECELRFRVTVDGDQVTGRYVDFIKKQGLNRGKETIFGKDLIGIIRKVYSERIITALHCVGPERQDGTRLEVNVEDNDAYQNWNWKGHHLIGYYEPESVDQDITIEQLTQLGETELKKRIAAAIEYEVEAVSLEHILEYEHEITRLGDSVKIKDEHFNPPMYLDSRVIFVDRSVFNKAKKSYKLGEVIEYKKEDVMKTWRELQALYATKVIKSPNAPPGKPNIIWIKTGGTVEIAHTWDSELNEWVPTGGSLYTWVMYADDEAGNGISSSPAGKEYIGFAYNKEEETPSLNPGEYSWAKLQGDQGVPGPPGEDGQTPYFHTAWADSADGTVNFSTTTAGTRAYIGTYSDFTSADSSSPAKYKWVKVQGPKGDKGDQGPQGPKGDIGPQGLDGENAILAILSNDAHTVPTDSAGNNGNFAGASSTMSVFIGSTDDSANWSYVAAAGSGVTGSLTGGTYTVTAMSGDTGYVDITASRLGYPSVTRRFTLSKAKQGSTGGTGQSATAYWLVTDVAAIAKNQLGAYTPASLTITGKSQVGTGSPGNYSGRFVIAETTDGSTFTDKYTSSANEATKSYTPSVGIKAVRVRMYLTGGTTSLIDEELIPIVTDGATGPKGDTGPQGLQGLQGPKGDQGLAGPAGTSSYTHIAYATNATGTSGFSVSDSTNKTYIGIYVDSNAIDSTDPSKYAWTLIKGADGSQGLPGPKGDNGLTPYFHTAWANNSAGTSGFSTTDATGRTFIGTYTDYTSADSTDPSKYTWQLVQGPKGDTGATGPTGPKGDTGSTGPRGPEADEAMLMNVNPNFYDWSGTIPNSWVLSGTAPTKVASGNGTGNSVKTVLAAGGSSFIHQNINNRPYSNYVFIETTFMIENGTIDGAGVLFRLNNAAGSTPAYYDYKIDFKDLVPNPTLGKWYTVSKVIATSTPVSFSNYTIYAMAGWSGFRTVTAKTIQFDSCKVKPATDSDYLAYEAKRVTDAVSIITNGVIEVDGGAIKANSVTSREILVQTLSALAANLGKITAGDITGVTMNLAGGKFVVDSSGNVTFKGALSGATGTFSGKIDTPALEITAPNFNTVGYSRLRMRNGSGTGSSYTNDGFIELHVNNKTMKVQHYNDVYQTWGEFDDFYIHSHLTAVKGISVKGDYNLTTDDRGWIAPSLLNGVSNYGGGYQTAGYYKDAMGFVHIRGFLTGSADGKHIFTLPAGYRPSAIETFSGYSNNSVGTSRITIRPDGNVYATVSGNWLFLDGITFMFGG